MEDEKLKSRIGKNIAAHRKHAGLTQAGLAEKLNYSDKAVSKWERGESAPDVLTMIHLAEQFEVTVNDLIADPDVLPAGDRGNLEKAMSQVSEKALKRKANKNIILGLSSLLVWFVALFFYVVLASVGFEQGALAFLYAIPADAIVLLSLRSAWRDFRWNKVYISTIVWGCLLSFHISMLVLLHVNVWRIYLLGIPGQLAIFLWFRLFSQTKNSNSRKETEYGQEGIEKENP